VHVHGAARVAERAAGINRPMNRDIILGILIACVVILLLAVFGH
jgi:hypothetical protein